MNIIEKTYKWNGNIVYMNENEVQYLIYHHAAAVNCTADDIHRWHLNNGWKGIGYNYFIDKEGNIYRGRPEMAEGGHTEGYNRKGIAICVEGDYSKETMMPEAQVRAVIELSKDILSRHPQLKVVGHRDLNATSCPGNYFHMDEIKAGIKGEVEMPVESKKLYRIRKSWDDAKSQKGAYVNLDSAKKECPVGYTVYDWNGNAVYSNKKPSTPTSTVKKNCVHNVQEYLNKNYNSGLSVDGIWGSKTEAAVLKVLQRAIGASVDGIWGNETYSKCPVVGNGDVGESVKVVQMVAAKYGYTLDIDGIWGAKTEDAVRKIQKKLGVTVDGLVGKNTFKAMFA